MVWGGVCFIVHVHIDPEGDGGESKGDERKWERDWTLGFDPVIGSGLLIKAPKGVKVEVKKKEKRNGSPYPMLSVESSWGCMLSHCSVLMRGSLEWGFSGNLLVGGHT